MEDMLIMKVIITTFDVGNGYARELEILRNMGLEAEYRPLNACQDPAELVRSLSDADFVLAGVDYYSAPVFENLKGRLRMISRLGTGLDKVDVDAATRCGVAVCNTPGANAGPVAQHTLALMLDVALRISQQDQAMRRGEILPRRLGSDLLGKTFGLVGFGHITRKLIPLLKGFGGDILVLDKHHDEGSACEYGVTLVDSLEEIAVRSDFVSLHIPLNTQNHHLIDAAFFRLMKPTAFLINTSRGPLVNETDLIRALEDGTIAGAGLDVFEENPLSADSPLLQLPNTVLTPYVAYATELSHDQVLAAAMGSIEDMIQGRPIRNLRNPDYVNFC